MPLTSLNALGPVRRRLGIINNSEAGMERDGPAGQGVVCLPMLPLSLYHFTVLMERAVAEMGLNFRATA